MQNNSQASIPSGSTYLGKTGEVVSYVDHPVISINEITIKYLGSTPRIPATEQHVSLSGTDKFEVINSNGKSFSFGWSSGTGELGGPSHFLTEDGCYQLHINVIIGERLEDITGKLVLNKVSDDKCGTWAKDLR